MSAPVLVTEELLEKGKSARGGWTRAQTTLLGEPWPLTKGWKRRTVGREIPQVDADRFVVLGTGGAESAVEAAAVRQLVVDVSLALMDSSEILIREGGLDIDGPAELLMSGRLAQVADGLLHFSKVLANLSKQILDLREKKPEEAKHTN